jgi:predicted GNAT family N-acyltransferase
MTEPEFTVTVQDWSTAARHSRRVREQVFVQEQGVPLELEWDGLDGQCIHAVARLSGGEAIGTARITARGRIGRMAVLQSWRGRGVGSALLQALLSESRKRNIPTPHLHAQSHALGFYERHGFRVIGGEFMDAGIPHRKMVYDERAC